MMFLQGMGVIFKVIFGIYLIHELFDVNSMLSTLTHVSLSNYNEYFIFSGHLVAARLLSRRVVGQ